MISPAVPDLLFLVGGTDGTQDVGGIFCLDGGNVFGYGKGSIIFGGGAGITGDTDVRGSDCAHHGVGRRTLARGAPCGGAEDEPKK